MCKKVNISNCLQFDFIIFYVKSQQPKRHHIQIFPRRPRVTLVCSKKCLERRSADLKWSPGCAGHPI